MKKVLFLTIVLVAFAGAGDTDGSKVYEREKKRAEMDVEMRYLQTKEALRALKREIEVRRKKERYRDRIEEMKRSVAEKMSDVPPPSFNLSGVVGRYAIVNDGYALPSGTHTPYGTVFVRYGVATVNGKVVFPYMFADYTPVRKHLSEVEGIRYYPEVSLVPAGSQTVSSFSPPP